MSEGTGIVFYMGLIPSAASFMNLSGGNLVDGLPPAFSKTRTKNSFSQNKFATSEKSQKQNRKSRLGWKFWRSKLACRCTRIAL